MTIFAMLSYIRRLPSLTGTYKILAFTEYWPIGFVALGVFLFFRSDAETWPLGPIGFWESTFNNGEVLQHRIATLLVFMLGIIELRARFSKNASPKLTYAFPLLCAFGGLIAANAFSCRVSAEKRVPYSGRSYRDGRFFVDFGLRPLA